MFVRLEFLGHYGAADVSATSLAEWPPHPDRLFQAFVDAAEGAAKDSLLWLESQPAPAVDFPDAVPLEWHRGKAFVPVNYPLAALPEAREKQARVFPITIPNGSAVTYVWPDPPEGCLGELRSLAGRISHVGRSDSLVMVAVCEGDHKARAIPDAMGRMALRVPYAGRLGDLDAAFSQGRGSPVAPHVAYAYVDSLAARSPWAELITVRLVRPLSLHRIVEITDALRRAVLSHLGDTAPFLAHGHGSQPHIGWLGLPNLSPYHPGELLGLAMAIPRGADSLERAECVRALLQVDHVKVGGRRIGVERPTKATSTYAGTWCRSATTWRSVTPVVLDRFPKRNLTIESVVSDSVERAGYPKPKRVQMSQESGGTAPDARSFKVRRPGRLYAHAEIEFHIPVEGPVLVGAERYFGLGLFLPARTSSDGESPGGSRS